MEKKNGLPSDWFRDSNGPKSNQNKSVASPKELSKPKIFLILLLKILLLLKKHLINFLLHVIFLTLPLSNLNLLILNLNNKPNYLILTPMLKLIILTLFLELELSLPILIMASLILILKEKLDPSTLIIYILSLKIIKTLLFN